MPLVRIDLAQRDHEGFGKKVGEVVYRTMMDTINVPAHDNFQIINELTSETVVYDKEYLGIERTDEIIFIRITLNKGRTVEMKKAFYKTLAARLNGELGVRPEDIFVSLVEVEKENWSFGQGIAQYAE